MAGGKIASEVQRLSTTGLEVRAQGIPAVAKEPKPVKVSMAKVPGVPKITAHKVSLRFK